MSRTRPLLAATMIVRDEAANLPRCLASLHALRDVVDEIVINDTGSVDDTVVIGRRAGARVLEGTWHGDFARARNEALRATRATWAVVVDADETLHADAALLRSFLSGRIGRPPATELDMLTAQVVNLGADGEREQDSLSSVRIFRTGTVHYAGSVHEHPVRRDGRPGRAVDVPRSLVHVRHAGYATAQAVHAKAERNLAIAQAALDRMVAAGGPPDAAAARVLLDLGRSLLGLGRRQEAVEAFETLRELTPDPRGAQPPDPSLTRWRAQGTGLLAQLLLDEGGFDEVVLVLADDLAACGAEPGYLAWLRAQALARLGDRPRALELLRGVREPVDPMGSRLPLGPVLVARTLHAVAAGRFDEAGEALADAMAVHGHAAGHSGLLLELWVGRPGELGHRLAAGLDGAAASPARRAELVAELRAAGGAGEFVADAVEAVTLR